MAQPKLIQNPDGGTLKFISWNCKGLNSPIKRSRVLHHLQHLGAQIIFLQETHFKPSAFPRIKCGWIGPSYYSSFHSKSRGVAILIHKSVPFMCANVISDPGGRFLIITGKIYDTPVLLVNVYAPNWDNPDFFRQLFSDLPDMSSHFLILGGDFNCWLSPDLDRSSLKATTISRSARIINTFMDEFSISDPWRFFNPSGKTFSFFSHVHHTFTRIDYFLVDNRYLPFVNSCSYGATVISDHSPVIMNVQIRGVVPARSAWRFNIRLLSSEKFVEMISDQIDIFLSVNKTADVSPSVLWETLKAYIRGQIISFASYERKQKKKKLDELTTRINQLDALYTTSPSPDLYKERLSLQSEFDTLTTDNAVSLLLKSRSSFYEQGDKAGKLLAHQLRQSTSSHQIPQLNTPTGLTIDPQTINDRFKNYYAALYTSETSSDTQGIDNFFSTLEIPSVSPDLVDNLEMPISIEELSTAISSMQSGKCPGPDGYPIEFYKKFQHKLAPVLIDMYNESFRSLKLPPTLNQACISLILKKNKDPLSCSSYRPISLLNVDFKLLSKMLALRLETVLPTIISPNQTGFIKNRHSFFNLRRLLNTIYQLPHTSSPEAVIALDAEKAFDRVEWGYLFHTLEAFGFGKNFVTWIKLLYSSPVASVKTNSTQSEYFPLHRSTRQGCPLSPLLFVLAIEPLSIALCSNSCLTGIFRNGVEQRVSLYADDLLLYISNFAVSIPTALTILNSFGAISGYKLNLNKSELFPLNRAAHEYPLHSFPFKIAMHSFTYLGIQVTDKFQDLYKANFLSLLTRVREDFDRWSVLNLSLAARINSVKMNTLPKFLYLFQCLPIFLTHGFFRKIDTLILEFIWNKKVPRIRKQFLQRTKMLGGMALPNFKLYYWAANLKIIQFWAHSGTVFSSPFWLEMEAASCGPVSLSALAHAPIKSSSANYTGNIIVRTSLRIWNQFRRHFGLQTYSILAPITANHMFQPSLVDAAFTIWSNLGIKSFKDLYIDNVFASFEQLSEKFDLPKHHLFRFFQIRSFVINTFPRFPNVPIESPLDTFLKPAPALKGLMSYFYSHIHSLCLTSLDSIKETWEVELGEEIPGGVWEVALQRVHKSSICAKHGLIQCKIIHRAHLTKVRLAKIHKDVDPSCDRCHQAPANHVHMFWSCSALLSFWRDIFASLSQVTGKVIEPNPMTALFGTPPPPVPPSSSDATFIAFVTLLARRLILLRWRSPSPPSHTLWIKEILNHVKLERIRCVLSGSLRKFHKIWDPFFVYVGKLDFPSIPD